MECTIDPAKANVLAALRAEHYEFLVTRRGDIVFGGPARANPEGPPQTMVMVVEAASAEAAEAFIAAEPYNRHGGFTRVVVRPWSQVLPELAPGALQQTLDAERAARDEAGPQ